MKRILKAIYDFIFNGRCIAYRGKDRWERDL